MTTKKRHDTMRKAKPLRLTARKPNNRPRKGPRTAGMSPLLGAGFKTVETIEMVDKAPDAAHNQFPTEAKPPISWNTGTIKFNGLPTPEQAQKIADTIARNPQLFSYSAPCNWSGISDSVREGALAHEEVEAALNRAHDVSPGELNEDEPSDGWIGAIPGYEALSDVLLRAYNQAAVGKGYDRHGRGAAFDVQPTQIISDLLDSDAGLAFQAIKKVNEGMRLEHDAKIKEMLGAINYIASIVIHMERNKK